jgi:hypothetical protein
MRTGSTLATFALVAAAGCSVESRVLQDNTPRADAGGSSFRPGIPITPNAFGYYDGANAAQVTGYWWATGDDYGAPNNLPGSGACPMAGFPDSACSLIESPVPGHAFVPDPDGHGMCTAGQAAQVVTGSDGQPAYGAMWGNEIAFDLNSPWPQSPDAGAGIDAGAQIDPAFFRKGLYDAPYHGVTGIAFNIENPPPGGVRVGFETLGTEYNPAFWQGATNMGSPIHGSGSAVIHWKDVGGPFYLPEPPPFDPTKLESVVFQIDTNTEAPIPYSFCINDVVMLTD